MPLPLRSRVSPLTWTVKNNGNKKVDSPSWRDAFYLSRDQIFDRGTDVYLGFSDRTDGLVAGASYTNTASFALPKGLAGSYYVFAATDSGNEVQERTGELNNAGYDAVSMQINLPQPADLAVSTITVPTTGVTGQPTTISYSVTNQGANAALGSWTDSIYLSADNQWDIGDALLERVQHVGDVASGATYDESFTAPLPGVLPGNYHVIVRSDIQNQIPEPNEGNNLKVSLNQISVDAERLALGTPDTGLLRQGQSVYYRVDVAAGESLLIDFDSVSSSAFNELYVSYGAMPTRASFDFGYTKPSEADQQILVPTTLALHIRLNRK